MAVPRKGSVVIVEIELPRLLLLVPHQRRPVKVAYPGGGGPGREHRIALRDQQRLFALVPMNPIDGRSPHYAQHHPGRIPRKRPVQRFRRRTESHVIHPVAEDDRRIAHMPRMVIMPVAVGRSEQRRGPILRSVVAPTAVFTKHLPTIQIARTGMVDRIAAGIFGIRRIDDPAEKPHPVRIFRIVRLDHTGLISVQKALQHNPLRTLPLPGRKPGRMIQHRLTIPGQPPGGAGYGATRRRQRQQSAGQQNEQVARYFPPAQHTFTTGMPSRKPSFSILSPR